MVQASSSCHGWATFVPISTVILLVVNGLVDKNVLFSRFFYNFCRNKCALRASSSYYTDSAFVPNLTFVGLLSVEISLGEKPVTHPPTQTHNLFRDPWTSGKIWASSAILYLIESGFLQFRCFLQAIECQQVKFRHNVQTRGSAISV